MRDMRRAWWLLVLALAGALLIARLVITAPPVVDRPRLTWIATAQQYGPVGYRDPAGAISPDGRWIAYSEGRFLRVRSLDGGSSTTFPAGPAQIRRLWWEPDSRVIITESPGGNWGAYDRIAATYEPRTTRPVSRDVACVEMRDGRPRIANPCGGNAIALEPDVVPYGPVALSPDGLTVYFAAPNVGGTVDLWSAPARGSRARQLTWFSRDTYAPTVAATGTVLFKVQSYRTFVAQAPAGGGPTRQLALFRSETPSWHPRGDLLGITYGTWRRVIDDAKYPDIAQDAGIIKVSAPEAATAVAEIVDNSPSEDQSLCWSPNGQWIAYHSHKDQSDDIWLRAADGQTPGTRLSFLGRGAETGWPRWSPDGLWVLFDGADPSSGRSVMYIVGVNQDTGQITAAARKVAIQGLDADISHAEWLGGSNAIIAVAKEGPGQHVIFTVARDGGDSRIVHRLTTEHDAPGLGVSPDGMHVAFVAPAGDGYFQIFRMPVAGGLPQQVTRDPSHKTQPAWSPDGRSIAFTVWSYEAQFWTLRP